MAGNCARPNGWRRRCRRGLGAATTRAGSRRREGEHGAAAQHYANAARGGERRGFRRLIKLTHSERCSARESAARALGGLGDSGAVATLETLQEGHFPDEGDDSTLGSIFGCSSRRAARDALEHLRSAE